MDIDVRQKLADWLAGRLKVGSDYLPGIDALNSREIYFIDVHVSDLFPRGSKSPKQLLDRSYEAFISLTKQLGRNTEYLMAVLAIPLQETDDPHSQPPSHDTITEELSATPPTIYVVNREWFRFMNPLEIRKEPLRWAPIHNQTSEACVTYRVCRRLTGIVNKWEFERTVEVEHYPPSLIPVNLWQDWLSFVHADRHEADRIAREWREALQHSLFAPRWSLAERSRFDPAVAHLWAFLPWVTAWPYQPTWQDPNPPKRKVKAPRE